jgi:Na+/H+ antiporter NhaD/arsenite permease-like protein
LLPDPPPQPFSDPQIFAAYAVFLASYLVFALGKFPGMKIDRPGAAIIGAVLMVAFGIVRPEDALRLIDFGTIVLLFSMVVAALSNVISNVPAVMLLKSVVPRFANPDAGWLVLAMATTLAGNLTITGSVANIIVAERAKDAAPIRFGDYFRVGLPVTVATLLFGSIWLWLID